MSYHVGLKKHSADARAFSFIKILNLMQNMIYPPQMLFVENVVGFEVGVNFLKNSCWLLAFQHWISLICLWQVSDTHDQLLEVLSNLNFNTQEFILSPLQFGVPYSRPRYFCLVRTFEYKPCHGILTVLIFHYHFICSSLQNRVIEWGKIQGIRFLGLVKYDTCPSALKKASLMIGN